MAVAPVSAETLCRQTDPTVFPFKSTTELGEPQTWLGQSRAVEAVRFGIGMKRAGFNLLPWGPADRANTGWSANLSMNRPPRSHARMTGATSRISPTPTSLSRSTCHPVAACPSRKTCIN